MPFPLLIRYKNSQVSAINLRSLIIPNRGAIWFTRLLVVVLCSFIWTQEGLAQCSLAITQQPAGATKCVGDTYTFTATVTGTATFQWQKDGIDLDDNPGDIDGATTPQLTLTDLCATCDPGQYVLIVSGIGSCSATQLSTRPAQLIVNTPVAITTQPQPATVCEGAPASFAVQASGSITAYQWFRNGTAISGATSASYQLSASPANNNDTYKVDVVGSCGTLTSSSVTLTVNSKPSFTTQPAGATKCVGDTYTFTAAATNAGSYQWQKDGNDLAGATAASLVLTPLQAASAGSYRVRIGGSASCNTEQVVSEPAQLIVNTPVAITTQPTATTVCEGAPATFAVQASGSITAYQWFRNGTAISGATSASYQLSASPANNNDTYKVDVVGSCGTLTSSSVTLTVNPKPSLTAQPAGATKCVGENYTFTVAATNAGSYQWQKDGNDLVDKAGDISGATTSQLTLTDLCATCDPGQYVLIVSGIGSCSATQLSTQPAQLIVNTPVAITTQPTATTVCEGAPATFAVQASGSITAYQWFRNGTAISGATSASYQLSASPANHNDTYKVDVVGSCGTLTSSNVTLTVNSKPSLTTQPVGATKCVGENYTFTVAATNAGSYQWQKDGNDLVDKAGDISGATTSQLTLTDLCATCDPGQYVLIVSGIGSCSATQLSTRPAQLIVNTPVAITTQPQPATVCEGAPASFAVQASGSITAYQWFRNGTAISGATSASYQLSASPANNNDTYKVDVVGSCGTLTSSSVTLTVNSKPSFTTQPAGATKCVGDTYTFTAAATNAGSYQWQKDGNDLAGATAASLVLTPLQAASAGSYRVRIGGSASCNTEQVVSEPAQLIVNTPVAITTQPTATTVCEGAPATFAVQASGSITAYQWFRNGTAISGATSASYQLSASPANNNDTYKVDVVGSCGTLTSSSVTLTVNPKPSLTAQPAGATKCVGENYTFTVAATNAGSYQWQKDGNDLVDKAGDISGATTSQLTLTDLCATCDPGQYVLIVSGIGSCSATQLSTQPAQLIVNTPVAITTQPTATTVCEGAPATFAVQASGSITAYQWFRNGTAISGATSASYQLSASPANHNDTYKVDVVGSCGTLTSSNVTLTVNPKPSLTNQPAGATKCVGDTYTFTVTATNAGSYQWQKDGNDIIGATTAMYTVAAIQPGDAGTYRVRLTGTATCSGNALVSTEATLVVNVPIVITTSVVSQTTCEGSSVTFAPAASGTITGYRWYRNGQPLGTTDRIYTLTATLANQNDSYRVELIGPCGTVTTAEATLTVIRIETPTITTDKPDGLCVGDQTTLTAKGCTGAVTWFLDDNAVGLGSTFTTGQAGAYTASCANQGCSRQPRSNVIQVIQLSPVTFTATVQNVTCFAGQNGSVTIIPGGAAGAPYNVSWTNPTGITNATVKELGVGTYTFTITDRAGCTATGSQPITQPTQPTGSVAATDVTCNGQQDGRLAITARSDYGGYAYSVNGAPPVAFAAGATQTLTNLDKGTYTIRVIDARSCDVLTPTLVSINEPSALTALIGTVKQPLSADSRDGSIEMSASGGTGPYTGRWYDANGTQLTTPVQTTATSTGITSRLSPVDGGLYRFVVTDRNGCERSLTQTLVAPQRLVATITTEPVTCFGRTDGTATVSVTGGVALTSQPPYQTIWRRQGTTAIIGQGLAITGLAPGSYEVTVTDANGISTTATAQVIEPALLKTTVSQIRPNYCTNLPLGEVTLQTEGGRAPYRITWNGNTVSGSTITKIPGGRHTFTVTDASGCIATTEAVVPDSAATFTTRIAYTAPTCFGRCDGMLTSTVQGGTAPYQYNWRNLSVTTPTALSVCGSGETALTIQDAKGCVITSTVVSLTAPAPRVLGLPGTQEVCPSKPFELSAASLTWGKTFIWTLPNSTTQTGATIQASAVGTYQITVLDENSCGGQGTILVRQFTYVNQLFTVPSEAVAGKSVVAVDLTSPAPASIRWELPGGTIVSQNTYQAKLSFAQVGTYSITEIATVDNCDYRLTKTIDIKASLDDNGFPRPMNAAPLEVTVMSNPTVSTTLQLAITNPADEDFLVTVQPISGHQRVFGQEYSKHGSNPLTVNLPNTVTAGLYVLTVQTATVRITKHILISQ